MADFTFVPHHTEISKCEYNTLKTDMEGSRVKTRLISSEPLRGWKLVFRMQGTEEKQNLLDHYKGQSGGTVPFNWTSIPSDLEEDTTIRVRYEKISFERIATGIWDITIDFVEDL